MGKEVTCSANWLWSVATKGVGLTHAKTGPLADRGGDAWTIGSPKAAVNHLSQPLRPIRFAAMTRGRRSLEIRPFASSDLDAAAALLAERHRRHRSAEPAMDPAYEAPAATRAQVEALLADETATGWVASRGGRVVGFLIGVAKADATWGPNVWVEAPGHAAEEPDVVRELYATAAGQWVG